MGLENWVGAACSSACGKRIDSPYPQITHQQPYIYTEPGFAPPKEMCHLNRSKESGALMNCLEVGLGSDLTVRSWPQPLLDPGPPTALSSLSPSWNAPAHFPPTLPKLLQWPDCAGRNSGESWGAHVGLWRPDFLYSWWCESVLWYFHDTFWADYCWPKAQQGSVP